MIFFFLPPAAGAGSAAGVGVEGAAAAGLDSAGFAGSGFAGPLAFFLAAYVDVLAEDGA